jgi:predicted DNA-binding protein (UPF0278 family)
VNVSWPNIDTPAITELLKRVHRRFGRGMRVTPEDVSEAIEDFTNRFPDTKSGSAASVLVDRQLSRADIGECIAKLVESLRTRKDCHNVEAIHFLSTLLLLDEDERYDDDDEGVSINRNAPLK